jgi:predicted phage baseplate assembly protein
VESGNTPPDPSEHYIIGTENWGAICELPEGPLAYRETPIGGDTPPQSTLQVDVKPKGGSQEAWQEVISFIHSAESDAHFVVETDEKGRSRIRFGDGINGRKLPEQATVECRYQVGFGPAGNVGADKLRDCHRAEIEACWNPFDVTNGTAPEPAAEIIRRAPEACRFRQLRAVTLPDYKVRAQELEPVSRAAASYAWTGSWRAVQVTVDPKGTTELVEERRSQIVRYLDAVKLIGEDLEILPPRFVPLDIRISLCAAQDFWTEEVRSFLLLEFSDGYTPDGRMAFFHPDLWTFGQPIRASQILGRVQSVAGVDHVIQVALRRWQGPSSAPQNLIEVRPNEIILVKNDPDHLEKGFITFAIFGGRR